MVDAWHVIPWVLEIVLSRITNRCNLWGAATTKWILHAFQKARCRSHKRIHKCVLLSSFALAERTEKICLVSIDERDVSASRAQLFGIVCFLSKIFVSHSWWAIGPQEGRGRNAHLVFVKLAREAWHRDSYMLKGYAQLCLWFYFVSFWFGLVFLGWDVKKLPDCFRCHRTWCFTIVL